jgi:hypothetical protein
MSDINFSIKITEGEALDRALLALEPSAAKSILSRSFGKYRRNITKFAQAIAPSDTGELVRNIKARKLRTPPGLYRVSIGLKGSAFPGAFYPGHVDLGTSRFGPSPFMEDSFDFYLPAMERDLSDDLWRGVERAWSRAYAASKNL